MKRNLLSTSLGVALAMYAGTAIGAVNVPVYRVIPPTSNVAGLNTLSANIGGNQGGPLASDVVAGVRNKHLGKSYKLMGLGKMAEFPVYEPEVDILTLDTVTSGGDVQVGGSASGQTQVVSAGTKVVVKDGAEVTLQCVQKKASLTFDIQVNSVTGSSLGQLADTVDLTTGKACRASASEARGALPGDGVLFDSLRRSATGKILHIVKPMWSKVVFDLEKDKSTAKFVKSIKKGNNVGPSISGLKDIVESDPYNYAAMFSLGSTMEMFGDFENAIAQYEKAGQLKQTKHVKQASERAENRLAQAQQLKDMGMNVFGALPSGSSGMRLALKGSSSKRTPITTEPGGGDTVVALPGKLTVEVVEESGGYYKVKAPDGKEGWISKSSLK